MVVGGPQQSFRVLSKTWQSKDQPLSQSRKAFLQVIVAFRPVWTGSRGKLGWGPQPTKQDWDTWITPLNVSKAKLERRKEKSQSDLPLKYESIALRIAREKREVGGRPSGN